MCLTPCDALECKIFQTRILEWVAISFTRGSSQRRNWTQFSSVSCIQILYHYMPPEFCLNKNMFLLSLHILLIFTYIQKLMTFWKSTKSKRQSAKEKKNQATFRLILWNIKCRRQWKNFKTFRGKIFWSKNFIHI